MATHSLRQSIGKKPQIKDRTGHKSGKLTALEYVGVDDKTRCAVWRCSCECGKFINVIGAQLSKTASCGCVRSEITKRHPIDWSANITHGDGGSGIGSGSERSREYIAWSCMIQRCTNPKHIGYNSYGGKGISVCDRWLNSYESFLYDLGRKPTQKHSIDRIDHNGNYTPENCKWSSCTEQQNNKSTNVNVVFKGEQMTCANLARYSGVPDRTIYHWAHSVFPENDLTTKVTLWLAKHQSRLGCR